LIDNKDYHRNLRALWEILLLRSVKGERNKNKTDINLKRSPNSEFSGNEQFRKRLKSRTSIGYKTLFCRN